MFRSDANDYGTKTKKEKDILVNDIKKILKQLWSTQVVTTLEEQC